MASGASGASEGRAQVGCSGGEVGRSGGSVHLRPLTCNIAVLRAWAEPVGSSSPGTLPESSSTVVQLFTDRELLPHILDTGTVPDGFRRLGRVAAEICNDHAARLHRLVQEARSEV